MGQAMSELEERLREESTEDLQHKIRVNMLTEEASGIARAILLERDAAIPIPETEQEAEAKIKTSNRRSTQFFYSIIVWAALVWLYVSYREHDVKGVQDFVYWTGLAVFWPFVMNRQKK